MIRPPRRAPAIAQPMPIPAAAPVGTPFDTFGVGEFVEDDVAVDVAVPDVVGVDEEVCFVITEEFVRAVVEVVESDVVLVVTPEEDGVVVETPGGPQVLALHNAPLLQGWPQAPQLPALLARLAQ
jgi:hypothetical protein